MPDSNVTISTCWTARVESISVQSSSGHAQNAFSLVPGLFLRTIGDTDIGTHELGSAAVDVGMEVFVSPLTLVPDVDIFVSLLAAGTTVIMFYIL